MRLLVVEDTRPLAEYVSVACHAKGFVVDLAYSLSEARAAVAGTFYETIVLDLGLPDGDGLEWLQEIRRAGLHTPVLILSARDAPQTVVEGLDFGADDYLTKPFEIEILVARIRALLRRPSASHGTVLTEGNVSFDTSAREARVGGDLIKIGRRELDSLELLLRRTGRVVPKEAFQDAIYPVGEEIASNAIEVLIHRLRKRIRDRGAMSRSTLSGGSATCSVRGLHEERRQIAMDPTRIGACGLELGRDRGCERDPLCTLQGDELDLQ